MAEDSKPTDKPADKSADKDNKDAKDKDKKSTEGQATDAKGNVLEPGSVVPYPGFEQDPELAEKGIYQPRERAWNAARTPAGDKAIDEEGQENHRKNLRNLPPVPSERAGAASQAK